MLVYMLSDPLPQKSNGQVAQARVEQLIDKMWKTLNAPAWFAAEGAEWTFRNQHHYLWHKRLGRVRVDLNPSLSVYIEPHTGRGRAFMRGEPLDASDQSKYIAQAIKAFHNDSFWLAAPFKVRDPGTHRSLVSDAEGEGVLVYYKTGGTTPGDRYLWRLGKNDQPKSWQLWVKIIPVQGMIFTWEDWRPSSSGALIAHHHRSKILDITLQKIKVTRTFTELASGDPHLTSPQWESLMSGAPLTR